MPRRYKRSNTSKAAKSSKASNASNENNIIEAIDGNDVNRLHELLKIPGIVNKPFINLPGKEGRKLTPLMYAAYKSQYSNILRRILDFGADVNAVDTKGNTAVMYAIKAKDTNNIFTFVNNLIVAGSDINIARADGMTPLMLAIKKNTRSIMSTLIDSGANPNAVDKQGRTPLWWLICMNKDPPQHILYSLVIHGADLNVLYKPDNLPKMTPLMYVINSGDYYTAKKLIEYGADINIPDENGIKPLDLALEKKNASNTSSTFYKSLITLLKNRGVSKEKQASLIRPWKGFTRSDISKLDTIFEDNANNYSCCPVCLEYVERSEACMYMKHNCTASGKYYHESLYREYKNPEGFISWCTICGRIADKHAHYKAATSGSLKPGLLMIQGRDPFAADCRGNGGGGLPEKLARFRKLRETALWLQGIVGKVTHIFAMNKLVEDSWDGPLLNNPKLDNIAKTKKWDVSLDDFPQNVAVNDSKVRVANVERPAADKALVPVVMGTGMNIVGDEGPLIKFRHRQPNGSINEHKDGLITEASLKEFLEGGVKSSYEEKFGYCYMYPGSCKARLYPEEVKGYVPDALYQEYKEKFNQKFGGTKGGGSPRASSRRSPRGSPKRNTTRRHNNAPRANIFVEAADAVCVIPTPTSSARFSTRKLAAKPQANPSPLK
jgi:ankyrin repeat protein